jgi:hypothetical protein
MRTSAPINRLVASSSLDFAMAIPRDPEFQMTRGLAIESYAGLEKSLAYLFSHLLEAPIDKASIVFFRIVNSRARNRILQDLLEKKYGDRFDRFWHGVPGQSGKKQPGLFAMITVLDERRNEVVHWHTVISRRSTKDGGPWTSQEELRPSVYWSMPMEDDQSRWLSKTNLQKFIEKSDFVSGSIWAFYRTMSGEFDPNLRDQSVYSTTWPQIFQKPPLYPPSDSHPLSPNYKAPGTPPQSSEA